MGSRSHLRLDILIRVGVQQQTADTILVAVVGEVITGDSVNARVKARVHLHKPNEPINWFLPRGVLEC